MVRPTTLFPSARKIAATVEESTPPDMATAMVLGVGMLKHSSLPRRWRQFSQPRDNLRNQGQRKDDIFRSILLTEAEANTGTSPGGSQAHRSEQMRGLNRARGTCGAG